MALWLNSAQTEVDRCCFWKVVWRRYLGEVGKFLSYFVGNLSRTLHINFYQNRSGIVEVRIKKFWCVFYTSQCRWLELDEQPDDCELLLLNPKT